MTTRHWNWHGRIFKFVHKFWELDISWSEPTEWTNYFATDFRLNRKADHAGFHFSLDIMRFSFEFYVYDHRHWDYDSNQWLGNGRTGTETELDNW